MSITASKLWITFTGGADTAEPRPDIIILDLNMPKKTGREVIQEIKSDSFLSRIPLVVLTSSTGDKDVLDGLDPERCLYLVKPATFQNLVDLAGQIHDFWLSLTGPEQEF